jgi:hypothetical protein
MREINDEIFCLQFPELSLELHQSPKSGKYQISDAPLHTLAVALAGG